MLLVLLWKALTTMTAFCAGASCDEICFNLCILRMLSYALDWRQAQMRPTAGNLHIVSSSTCIAFVGLFVLHMI